ncbi:unnamed protein product [Candidula unifasciata]|uniref:Uncharacterized protein n=1 Tax=Candidula unifasciata TaxID=100452 RepID=A0A8S3YVG4_9EUPU|nr:unnamed protein product [Candidula unifasciata]
MEQLSAPSSSEQNVQRLAAKSSYAADILKNVVAMAEDWQKIYKKVNRYMQQVKLIVTWKRGCAALKMVGSASKTVGSVLVVAAPLHPKLRLAVKVGHKLWKLGAGLKILTAVGNMLRDLWQAGCRQSVLEFVTATALLTRNLGVFGELIRDLQDCVQPFCSSNITQTSDQVLSLLKPFVPQDQLQYVTHVVNIIFHSNSYSPLFDLILTSPDLGGERSNTVQLLQEIESFRFTEFVQQGGSHFLVAIGSFLHVSRELLDFLDGFQKVTEQDCRFLYECLTRFNQESLGVLQAATVLTHLGHVRAQHVSPVIKFSHHSSTHPQPHNSSTHPNNSSNHPHNSSTHPQTHNSSNHPHNSSTHPHNISTT